MVENLELTQHKRENGTSLISFNPAPQHAFSLKAISNILHSILNDKKPSHHAAVSQLRSNMRLQSYFLKVSLEDSINITKRTKPIKRILISLASSSCERTLVSPESFEAQSTLVG